MLRQSDLPQGCSLVWAEIDLHNLKTNYMRIAAKLPQDVKFMTVVKANAYGHGTVRIGRELEKLGADYIAVSCLDEGVQLREGGVELPILILGYTQPECVTVALDYDLTVNVKDNAVLNAIAEEACEREKSVPVHIHVDTGLNLYGAKPQEALELAIYAEQHEYITLEGVYSHFSDAEADDLSSARKQIALFKDFIAQLEQRKINPPLIHMANGAAVVRLPEAHFGMVRVGTFLYGPQTGEQIPGFIPDQVLSLKTNIVHLVDVEPGESVGYGRAFIAEKRRKIACIPIGYGDGFRKMPNWGNVLVRGYRVPIVAGVSMDKTAIDVTNIPGVAVGDEVVLIGRQQNEEIILNEIAAKINASNYEVLSGITERVKRVYKG